MKQTQSTDDDGPYSAELVHIIGIDLSGPSNHNDSVLSSYALENQSLKLRTVVRPCSDGRILEYLATLDAEIPTVLALDAPLSYQDGGGDRPGDRALRSFVKEQCGEATRSVMTPTMTRMVYLTLRGISLSRRIQQDFSWIRIIEVHPTCGLQVRGLKPSQMKAYKSNQTKLNAMRRLLRDHKVPCPKLKFPDDHAIASAAAVLIARDFIAGKHRFLWPKDESHPFDYVL